MRNVDDLTFRLSANVCTSYVRRGNFRISLSVSNYRHSKGHWSSVTTGGNGKTRIQPEVFALCMCLPRDSN